MASQDIEQRRAGNYSRDKHVPASIDNTSKQRDYQPIVQCKAGLDELRENSNEERKNLGIEERDQKSGDEAFTTTTVVICNVPSLR